jgi:hypothetical protein
MCVWIGGRESEPMRNMHNNAFQMTLNLYNVTMTFGVSKKYAQRIFYFSKKKLVD